MNDEVSALSSATGAYVMTQEYVIRDDTTSYTWTINPDTKKVDAVYTFTEPTSLDDGTNDTKDITCTDWTVEASVFALPSGVKITDMSAAVEQSSTSAQQQSLEVAQKTLNPTDPVLKALILFVQKVQASPRTDIPDLRAFVSTWGAAVDSWNNLAQELAGVSVDTLSSVDLDALSARADKVQAEKIQILAAYNALSQDEISLLDNASAGSQ
jgi:hypothetical protein